MSYIINQDVPVGSALTQLDALSDVNISNPQDGDVLSYNGTTGKWVQNSNMTVTSGTTNITGCNWVRTGNIAILTFAGVANTSNTDVTITGAPTPTTSDFICPMQNSVNIIGYCLVVNKVIRYRTNNASGYGTLVYTCE